MEFNSKILIDVNGNGDPVVRITGFNERDVSDVRDKLVKVFLENYNRTSLLCIDYTASGDAVIRTAALDRILSSLLEIFPKGSESVDLIKLVIEREFGSVSSS